jgi:uncharacterized protein (DUF433 family)
MSQEEILSDYPELEKDDFRAVFALPRITLTSNSELKGLASSFPNGQDN